MALRARLVAPPVAPRRDWPWHTLSHGSVRASQLLVGDRRMEAESYLSSGFGVRAEIESRTGGWKRLSDLAKVWMPGRLKGIQVGPDIGTPFLAATQVYDVRPAPRKWLAIARTQDAERRFVRQGMILVTCSGAVGRPTLAYGPHMDTLVSHDLLRVEAIDKRDHGWLYAYLHSPAAQAMMTGAQYGHIIKHLETEHLDALPVPLVDSQTSAKFLSWVEEILRLRNRAHELRNEADERFARAIGPISYRSGENGFEVRAGELFAGRRRLEASYHVPRATAIRKSFQRFEALRDVAERVWWMPRFKRFYREEGLPYLSADELFTLNPPENKRILVESDDNHREYFVKSGWIVMACSGQVYGLNGACALMTDHHENVFFSHDLIRIVANPKRIRAGYLLVALSHRTLGRPLLIRAAYGTSIPHLDPGDVADFPVVRLAPAEEAAIADLAEAGTQAMADADALERRIAHEATMAIAQPVVYGTTPPLRRAAEGG